jgi:hypothetical protein
MEPVNSSRCGKIANLLLNSSKDDINGRIANYVKENNLNRGTPHDLKSSALKEKNIQFMDVDSHKMLRLIKGMLDKSDYISWLAIETCNLFSCVLKYKADKESKDTDLECHQGDTLLCALARSYEKNPQNKLKIQLLIRSLSDLAFQQYHLEDADKLCSSKDSEGKSVAELLGGYEGSIHAEWLSRRKSDARAEEEERTKKRGRVLKKDGVFKVPAVPSTFAKKRKRSDAQDSSTGSQTGNSS